MPVISYEMFFQRATKALGIKTQMELAQALDLNRSAISQAKRKGEIPDRWILELFRRYGINPDWIETGENQVFLKNDQTAETEPAFSPVLKVKARLCAGGGSFETEPGAPDRYLFKSHWLNAKGQPDKMVLMDIFGNSMEPELKDGDTVLVDGSQKDIFAGALYAVGIEDTIMVKRIEKHPGKLVLLSDNTDYPPILLKKSDMNRVRIIGKVLWVCRELK